jgi:hypothetical protein
MTTSSLGRPTWARTAAAWSRERSLAGRPAQPLELVVQRVLAEGAALVAGRDAVREEHERVARGEVPATGRSRQVVAPAQDRAAVAEDLDRTPRAQEAGRGCPAQTTSGDALGVGSKVARTTVA